MDALKSVHITQK